MWTYVRSMVGSFWPASGLGIRDARTESDSLIGKLAYQDSLTGFTINSTTIHGAVNDFQWIRNSASQDDGAWDLTHGINVVGRGF